MWKHKSGIFEIEFPQSCVLYIRNHRKRSLPDYHEAIVKFADGQQIVYRVPILTDYQKISSALEQCMDDKKSTLYIDLITLIEKIADHIIPKENEKVRERLGDLMGGKILQLESERLRELGEAKGRAEGRRAERIEAIQNMIKYDVSKEKILQDYSEEEYNEAVSAMLVEV